MELITIIKVDNYELSYKTINQNVLFKYKTPLKTFNYLIKNTYVEQKDNTYYCVFTSGAKFILANDIFVRFGFERIFYSLDYYAKIFEKFKYYKKFDGLCDSIRKFYKDCGNTIVVSSYIDNVHKLSIITKENYKKQIFSDEYYDLEAFEELFPEYFYNPIKIALRNN